MQHPRHDPIGGPCRSECYCLDGDDIGGLCMLAVLTGDHSLPSTLGRSDHAAPTTKSRYLLGVDGKRRRHARHHQAHTGKGPGGSRVATGPVGAGPHGPVPQIRKWHRQAQAREAGADLPPGPEGSGFIGERR
jgi:hypothetical protein